MIVLQIIGSLVVAIVFFIAIFYFYVKSKYGKLLAQGSNSEPLAIHLNEDVAPTCNNWGQSRI